LLGISILAIFLGADTLHTGRGSHVFGWRSRSTPLGDLHYTGPFATLEGLGFIAGGVYGLYRGTRKDLESDDRSAPAGRRYAVARGRPDVETLARSGGHDRVQRDRRAGRLLPEARQRARALAANRPVRPRLRALRIDRLRLGLRDEAPEARHDRRPLLGL